MDTYDPHLDGTPDEFPHRAEAMETYRSLWQSWMVTSDPERKRALERAMDEEQVRICRGPGKVWHDFARTLPGFLAFWEEGTLEILAAMGMQAGNEENVDEDAEDEEMLG